MLYKVGDIVRVKPDLKPGGIYGGVWFAPKMKKYLGAVMHISRCIDNIYYRIKEDKDEWSWSGEMLEPYNPEDDYLQDTGLPISYLFRK